MAKNYRPLVIGPTFVASFSPGFLRATRSSWKACASPAIHADTLLDRAWCLFPVTPVFAMVFNAFLKGAFLATLQQVACAVSIADIQGASWVSTLSGQTVSNLTATVTAKGSSGFWIQETRGKNVAISNGLNVFTTSKTILASVAVGDLISLSGKVADFRSTSNPSYLFATELESPTNITILSTNNTVAPLVLGQDRSPPTQRLSGLDRGNDGWLSVPGNRSQIEVEDHKLNPTKYGMDFWKSLEGQLVTVPSPTATDFANSFGEFWVYGDWNVTGQNSRGGLTITIGPDNVPDANPETIIIGSPLDGTKNPTVSLGMQFSDITGVVVYQFGFYYLVPFTAPKVVSTPSSVIPPATIVPSDDECTITLGDYNIENMAPNSSHMPTVANHIANFLNTPDIMFVQEVQDNSGPTDDGVVIANLTLTNLSNAVQSAGNASAVYNFTEISPVNDQDGGEPGGNIRVAYLFNTTKFSLVPGSPAGGALDATKPKKSTDGVMLTFNPGRIDPTNAAWNASRKPLVAHWETPSGTRFFTVNLHLTAKLGGTSTQGDARPPINAGDQRTSQVKTVATFVKSLLKLDPNANIIVAGDCNEYTQTRSVFAAFDGLLTEVDVTANIPDVERYTYLFDQNAEQLDHMFVSSAIAARGGIAVEHVHVNNWAASLSVRASDHDPSVAQLKIC
uniref:Small G-protein Ras2 n=1 Tax=Ganoderma boninense TaxID=34458 RepID=A0A5K1K5C4_9APHY|nr:Small G-protein Ras2 [Ganoderma boninense]